MWNCSDLYGAPARMPDKIQSSDPFDAFDPPPSLSMDDAVMDQAVGEDHVGGVFSPSAAPPPECVDAGCGGGLQDWLKRNFHVCTRFLQCTSGRPKSQFPYFTCMFPVLNSVRLFPVVLCPLVCPPCAYALIFPPALIRGLSSFACASEGPCHHSCSVRAALFQ